MKWRCALRSASRKTENGASSATNKMAALSWKQRLGVKCIS
jgi:hypothetical protein